MSVTDAKANVLVLGRKASEPGQLLGNPAVRAAILLAAGAFLGRTLVRRRKDGAGASLRSLAMRAGLAAAPLLVEQFLRSTTGRTGGNNSRSRGESS